MCSAKKITNIVFFSLFLTHSIAFAQLSPLPPNQDYGENDYELQPEPLLLFLGPNGELIAYLEADDDLEMSPLLYNLRNAFNMKDEEIKKLTHDDFMENSLDESILESSQFLQEFIAPPTLLTDDDIGEGFYQEIYSYFLENPNLFIPFLNGKVISSNSLLYGNEIAQTFAYTGGGGQQGGYQSRSTLHHHNQYRTGSTYKSGKVAITGHQLVRERLHQKSKRARKWNKKSKRGNPLPGWGDLLPW